MTKTCEGHDQRYVVIENARAFEALESRCEAFVFADAVEEYTWEKANATEAKLVSSTVTSDPVSYRLLSLEFDSDGILHANDVKAALDFFERGPIYAVDQSSWQVSG